MRPFLGIRNNGTLRVICQYVKSVPFPHPRSFFQANLNHAGCSLLPLYNHFSVMSTTLVTKFSDQEAVPWL